jgi:hypothetical protein
MLLLARGWVNQRATRSFSFCFDLDRLASIFVFISHLLSDSVVSRGIKGRLLFKPLRASEHLVCARFGEGVSFRFCKLHPRQTVTKDRDFRVYEMRQHIAIVLYTSGAAK